MKTANKLVFEKLASYTSLDAVTKSNSKKFITSTVQDKNWLQKVKFVTNEDLFIDSHRYFALATLSNEKYVIQIGLSSIHSADEDLILQPNNNGIFVALVADSVLPVMERESLHLELQDNVFIPSDLNDSREFDASEIEKYFTTYQFYKLASSSSLLDADDQLTLQKTALYLLAKSTDAIYLKISDETLVALKNLARLDVKALPLERIFRAFIERRYEHTFLDLYRCLEMLYSLRKIDDLKTILNLNSTHFEISAVIEKTLGWRPTEKSALTEIIAQFPPEIIQALKGGFRNTAEVCTNIYDLRNECVHFRPLQKKSTLAKNVNWIYLLESMVLAINQAYSVNYRKML